MLDVLDRKLHIYRMPDTDGYQSEMILSEELTIAPLGRALKPESYSKMAAMVNMTR
ncbi:hypothetical protein [Leptodesmis sichuanensis]|uniref:hypothetical protein n=1 Tax=Leptodesmis sichuanensis TaxID=2906798 RepID=UPI001F25B7F4|nr:hypothetical protein [Leptodesmis sichuanensis]UIE38479.1 hypothetical protein KIK02_02150 [Leptodesmis sichuanensis A121]